MARSERLDLRRRELLRMMLVLSTAGLTPRVAQAVSQGAGERWLSAQGDDAETFSVAWLRENARPQVIATGFRGHGLALHPKRSDAVIVVSRRPGTRALEIDLKRGEITGGFACPEKRQLFGHACFSADGRLLFTAEGDTASGAGLIVVRDALTYRVLDEWSSHGVGPHELRLMPGGDMLVVANGGIFTRPETGRRRLNLDSMQSSLTYLDSGSGDLVASVTVREPKASIRHLDVAPDGAVAFAMQMQRDAAGHDRPVPLAAVHRLGSKPLMLEGPEALIHKLRDYTGSVAICPQSRLAGFTSPRGSLAVFWHIDSGECLGYHAFRDVCGIDATPGRAGFVVSNSRGEMRELDGHTLRERRTRRVRAEGLRWDNHLLIAGAS